MIILLFIAHLIYGQPSDSGKMHICMGTLGYLGFMIWEYATAQTKNPLKLLCMYGHQNVLGYWLVAGYDDNGQLTHRYQHSGPPINDERQYIKVPIGGWLNYFLSATVTNKNGQEVKYWDIRALEPLTGDYDNNGPLLDLSDPHQSVIQNLSLAQVFKLVDICTDTQHPATTLKDCLFNSLKDAEEKNAAVKTAQTLLTASITAIARLKNSQRTIKSVPVKKVRQELSRKVLEVVPEPEYQRQLSVLLDVETEEED